jgi:predicted regulator of Ras-like GTPase activity (Roadblock/LC7/MglB family)
MWAGEAKEATIQDLRRRVGAVAAAFISRDGVVQYADLPDGVYVETFAIMCATALAAGTAAHRELQRAAPERLVLEATDTRTVIVGAGSRGFVVVVVDLSHDIEHVAGQMTKFASLYAAR